MPFTGKATYDAGSTLPELVEDVADIIGIISPHETPLLDLIGDPKRSALSTLHEWLEDSLLPNTDAINQVTFTPDALTATEITVDHGERFRVGDQVRPANGPEIMFVTAVSGDDLTVVRGYGSTTAVALANDMVLTIVGNAALEGDDAPAARFTTRVRRQNYTQIFSATVNVSGSMMASRLHSVADEVDYQTQERMRELLRDLENCVINGVAPAANPQGSSTVRRTMNGLINMMTTNAFTPDSGPIPPGGGGGNELTETVLNAALKAIWEQSAGQIDTMVMNGTQKRILNGFVSSVRTFGAEDTRYRDLVNVYESDYGSCRVLLSRWMPSDSILFLDSSRIEVMPLRGRSFHYKPLAATGDSVSGLVLGEYTLELRNENAHGVLTGLGT